MYKAECTSLTKLGCRLTSPNQNILTNLLENVLENMQNRFPDVSRKSGKYIYNSMQQKKLWEFLRNLQIRIRLISIVFFCYDMLKVQRVMGYSVELKFRFGDDTNNFPVASNLNVIFMLL